MTKYDASGAKQWTRQLGTANFDSAAGVATDGANAVYVAGHSSGAEDDQGYVIGAGRFVTKYDARGAKQWTRQLDTAGDDLASGVAVLVPDRVYLAGFTGGNLEGENAGWFDIVTFGLCSP